MPNNGITKAKVIHPKPIARRRERKKSSKIGRWPRGTSGPRTEGGKRRSRYNATKHAIFADGLIRKEESRSEYLALVDGLAESCQPVGTLEQVLVEKLATLTWRYRRLLKAEAEIDSVADDPEKENKKTRVAAPQVLPGPQVPINRALMGDGVTGLATAVELLKHVQETIAREGADWERDRWAIEFLYNPPCESGLVEKYRKIESTEMIVSLFEEEIRQLERITLERPKVAEGCKRSVALVLETVAVDRLLRYEGTLERGFDRTLAQLERLQRFRMGHPVPPPIKVSLSS